MSIIFHPDTRMTIDTACRTAEQFTKLYYKSVDKKRHQVARLYMANGRLVWNGHGAAGKNKIRKYFQQLPRSKHIINSLEAQPICGDAVPSQLTLIIQVAGYVKFLQNRRPFLQTFIITEQGEKWKIANDCYVLDKMQQI
ncbi:NTF2-related export protein-like [Sabethes cyaneus]|uniref:NTF2-related export protein-like n=1 Tax=Sabethes cyaneus TaxID=53552 RepID=UPI00237E98FB|nr:NTF2-related export protein-like [Sabethes cyaneus]